MQLNYSSGSRLLLQYVSLLEDVWWVRKFKISAKQGRSVCFLKHEKKIIGLLSCIVIGQNVCSVCLSLSVFNPADLLKRSISSLPQLHPCSPRLQPWTNSHPNEARAAQSSLADPTAPHLSPPAPSIVTTLFQPAVTLVSRVLPFGPSAALCPVVSLLVPASRRRWT